MCVQYNTVLFGENLQKKMEEKGISAADLQAGTGIKELDTVPEIEVLVKVCQTLDCDIKSLMS